MAVRQLLLAAMHLCISRPWCCWLRTKCGGAVRIQLPFLLKTNWRRHSLLRPLSAGPPPIPPSVLDGSVGHRVEAPGRGHPLSIKPRPMTARDAASPHNTSNRFGTSATASASTDFLQRPQRNIDRLLQL